MKRIQVQKYGDGRWGFDDYTHGKRRLVRCRSKEKALSRATDVSVFLANGRSDLLQIDAHELRQFREWQAASNVSISITEACAAFLTLKGTKSSRYKRSLAQDLKLFETFMGSTKPIRTITAVNIQQFIDSRNGVGERRQLNLRMTVVSLFRWARRMSYLPDRTTEAEKVEPIAKVPGTPNVLLPEEMRTLLAHVREDYLPWLCVAAFAGIRTEEIAPDRKSTKAPLRWEDFDWQNKVIIVRVETAKTKEEREVPIPDNLAEWLAPYRSVKGPICKFQPTHSETGRLGQWIGGWRHNCLRDSFCSYRTRITQNVHQTSYEMGNSPAMVKRSYHKRQLIEMAQAWFNIRPLESANVVAFSRLAP